MGIIIGIFLTMIIIGYFGFCGLFSVLLPAVLGIILLVLGLKKLVKTIYPKKGGK